MLHCLWSFVHESFAPLRFFFCSVGGDQGGVSVNAGAAVGEDFTLGTGKRLVGSDLWASRWGGLSPGSRQRFSLAGVLRLSGAVKNRCGSVFLCGGGSPLFAVRVCSCRGWGGWSWVMIKLHRLFSHFTVTGASVRKPGEHNGKLLMTRAATAYHLQLFQTPLCVQSRSPDRPAGSHCDYAKRTRRTPSSGGQPPPW